jgi:DNA polymerase-1
MPHAFDLTIPEPHFIDTEYEARRWIDRYLISHRKNGGLGLDTETSGLDRLRDYVIIWSLSDGETRICLDRKFLGLFKAPILENPEVNFDLTNVKFDMHMLANSGIDIVNAGELRCTVIQSWLYNENNTGRHGLKECMFDHFNRHVPTFEETFGKIPVAKKGETRKTVGAMIREVVEGQKGMDAFDRAIDYASLDAYDSTILRHHFDELLSRTSLQWGSLKDYYYRVEVPFTKVLYKMERRGITVDKGYLLSLKGPMEERMTAIERDFNHLVGGVFNPKSPKQLQKLFFDTLQLPIVSYTKGGKSGNKQPSTDAEALEEWAGQGNEWAEKLLIYRSIAKIYGTYVEGLSNWLDSECRIHTTLNQSGTVTGRLSSSEPNLQNIPRPDEDEFKIREAFIPGANKKLLVADYEQLEMRLLAHFSKSEKMRNAINNGMDIHSLTTAEIEGIPYDDVVRAKKAPKDQHTPEIVELLLKRQNNKSTGFGIVYGIGGPKLARKLTRETKKLVTEEEGWGLIKKWLAVYPDVEVHIQEVKDCMAQFGQVITITGRPRRFGDLANMSRRDRAAAERQGVNSEIQGTAAEACKYSMIVAENDPELRSLGVVMLLQIHDELIFEVPDDPEIEVRALKRVGEIMSNPFGEPLTVGLPVSAHCGYSWAEAK